MSLGIMNPKKRREIEGVSNNSMVELKATMFAAEAEAKRVKTGGSSGTVTKLVVKPVAKNKGVEERAARDAAEAEKRLDPSECLGEKMAQYHAMAGAGFRDEREKYLVDFEQKKWDEGDAVHGGAELRQGEVLPANVLRQDRDGESSGGGVLQELSEHTKSEQERQDVLKKKRLEAARKRMLAKANAK